MTKKISQKNLRSIFVLIFSGFMCVTGFITIQHDPIPFVIQNMIAVLCGSVLGSIQGFAAVGIFMIAGVLGLPVFANYGHGLETLYGPTGGYLIGYLFAALATGIYIKQPNQEKTPIQKIIPGCALGYVIIYILGIIQFLRVKEIPFNSLTIPEIYNVCIAPFLPFDLVKLICTIVITYFLRPFIGKTLFTRSK